MGAEQSYNFRRINASLTTSGVVGEDNLKALGAEGYALVINLLPDDSEYAVPGESEILRGQGIDYIHIPVDFGNPTMADFHEFAAALDGAGAGKVHIHCAANYRVSAFYSSYARIKGTMSEDKASELIGSLWDPAENHPWQAFIRDVVDGRDGESAPARDKPVRDKIDDA